VIPLATPLHLVPFVAVDVETTGLDPRRDAILEIGAVKVQNGQLIAEFDTLVHTDRTIPFGAKHVHGISNQMLVGKPPINDAMQAFLAFADGCVLVEHSEKAFDVAFLERANGGMLDAPYLNTNALSRRLFPFIPKHSLAECCRRHGIVNDRAHRALGDARATARLLIALLEAAGPRYPRLEDLLPVAAVERWSPRPRRRAGRSRRAT
jgi:DNA polymerase III epsilon subunit family exonuclease